MIPGFREPVSKEELLAALKAAAVRCRQTHTEEEISRFVAEIKSDMRIHDQLAREAGEFGAVYQIGDYLDIEAEAHDWGATAEAIGTRDELISKGLCADYMFDQLGEKKKRTGPTEYGDRFTLERRANERYKIELRLGNEAKIPYGMRSTADPYQTDISDILEQISGGVS